MIKRIYYIKFIVLSDKIGTLKNNKNNKRLKISIGLLKNFFLDSKKMTTITNILKGGFTALDSD